MRVIKTQDVLEKLGDCDLQTESIPNTIVHREYRVPTELSQIHIHILVPWLYSLQLRECLSNNSLQSPNKKQNVHLCRTH